jgi:hypothetical protein
MRRRTHEAGNNAFEGWSRPGLIRQDVRMLGDQSARDAEFTQRTRRKLRNSRYGFNEDTFSPSYDERLLCVPRKMEMRRDRTAEVGDGYDGKIAQFSSPSRIFRLKSLADCSQLFRLRCIQSCRGVRCGAVQGDQPFVCHDRR